MGNDASNDAMAQLRAALAVRMPEPTHAIRERAWRIFENALDRHLAERGPALGVSEPPR